MERERPNVLLVDDVPANLVALEALLGGLSCELVRAESGNEALKQLLKRPFAVMLLDVQMPEIDGYEVARYARDNPATRDVPIIFVTATHGSEENLLRGYGTGAVDFLPKPINAFVLRSKVQVFLELYLGRRRLADEVEAHEKTLHELQLTNATLRHFSNATSHDLKEPLRAIEGFLQMLSDDAGGHLEAQARDYLDRSRKAARRMTLLLESLLAYAGLRKRVTFGEVNCAAVLDQVMSDLSRRIVDSHGTVTVGKMPVVVGDGARVYQLFLNLVGNALKFHRPGEQPKVAVSAAVAGREATFCVEDNGVGIAPEHQAVVFDPFRRLHNRAQFEGSGLGLTICREIVEQQGGRIWLESELGRGSKFWVSLPLAGQ
jgi:two-component system sensor histidine kinase/response regulator